MLSPDIGAEHRRVVDLCLRLLEESAPAASGRTIAIRCDRSSLAIAAALADQDPTGSVLVFLTGARPGADDRRRLPANCVLGTGASLQAKVLRMAGLQTPPVLVVEYDGRPGRRQRAAFPVFFGALRDGGHYVLRDNDLPVAHPSPGHEPAPVREIVRWYVQNRDTVTEAHGPWAGELSRSIGQTRQEDDLLIVAKRGDHVFKLHLDEMEEVGAARWGPQWAETLVRREPYVFTMPGRLVLANEGPVTPGRRDITVPARVLRRHHDVTLSRRMLLRRENIALPESFHHPHQANLRHPRLSDISRSLGRDETTREPRALEGSYFLLDSAYPGHFGHVTTEVLGKMWGWLELQRLGVQARPIVSTYVKKPELPAFQFEIFEAFGIARADVEIVRSYDVVRIPELYTATQQIESPRWIDRDIVATWKQLEAHVRRRAASVGESGLGADRIFVSRRQGAKRNCVNTAEVEDYFRSRGFAIYFPEDHSYLHQVETFARARRVAGFGGSGMFTMMFTPSRAKILVLTSTGYSATNELLLAAANGNDLTYVWGPAEQAPIRMGRHDRDSFRANYAIDLNAHRATLHRFTSRIPLS